jgi:septal ring factor EnvC (AmiA/AmiB activator)
MEHTLTKAKKRRLLWGLAGTILSALGFVGLALFEQYNGVLSELRADLKHFNETSSEYVKKDSFQRFRDHFRDCMKEFHETEAAKARLEQELKASEKVRDELTQEVHQMRERLAYVEGRQTATPTASQQNSIKKLEPHAN